MSGRWLRGTRWFVLGLLVTVLALVGVACGGGDDTAAPPTALPTPTPVDLSAITSELQRSISDAVSGIEVPGRDDRGRGSADRGERRGCGAG